MNLTKVPTTYGNVRNRQNNSRDMSGRQVGPDVRLDAADNILAKLAARGHFQEKDNSLFQAIFASLADTHAVLNLLEGFH